MPTVGERYAAAMAFTREAVAAVEKQPIGYRVTADGNADWFSGRERALPFRRQLAQLEERWLRATTDFDRDQIARDAEMLAVAAIETLPALGCRRDAGIIDVKMPAAVRDEMDTTAAVINQLDTDVAASNVERTFKSAWHAFVVEWETFYRERIGWWDRLWYGTYEKTVEYRKRALEWRQKFVGLGGVPSSPADKPPSTAGDQLNAVLKYALIGGGLFVGYKLVTGLLSKRRTEQDDTRRALNAELARVATRQASGTRTRARTYSVQLTRGELEALAFLRGRYDSARAFVDGLIPLDDSAEAALGGEFDRATGPYRFQIRANDVRKTLRVTADDGGDYGAIPNLASDAVAWVLDEERRAA